jgi:hypothetical protein
LPRSPRDEAQATADRRDIGSIIVGFDQLIFRTLPPAQELVAKARPVRGVSGQAPGLEVVFPDDVLVDAGGATAVVEPIEAPAPASGLEIDPPGPDTEQRDGSV